MIKVVITKKTGFLKRATIDFLRSKFLIFRFEQNIKLENVSFPTVVVQGPGDAQVLRYHWLKQGIGTADALCDETLNAFFSKSTFGLSVIRRCLFLKNLSYIIKP